MLKHEGITWHNPDTGEIVTVGKQEKKPDGFEQPQQIYGGYRGTYGGLNDAWAANNPDLAELAKEVTSVNRTFERNEDGTLKLVQGEDGKFAPIPTDSPMTSLPDEGILPGDMIDLWYLKELMDKEKAENGTKSKRYTDLQKIKKAATENRDNAFLDMHIKNGFQSAYNVDNSISPAESEVEHVSALSWDWTTPQIGFHQTQCLTSGTATSLSLIWQRIS